MNYKPDWMDQMGCGTELLTQQGFGTIWRVDFEKGSDEEEFENQAESVDDEQEVAEEGVSRSFSSRMLVVTSGGKETWTSDLETAMQLMGGGNNLFTA